MQLALPVCSSQDWNRPSILCRSFLTASGGISLSISRNSCMSWRLRWWTEEKTPGAKRGSESVISSRSGKSTALYDSGVKMVRPNPFFPIFSGARHTVGNAQVVASLSAQSNPMASTTPRIPLYSTLSGPSVTAAHFPDTTGATSHHACAWQCTTASRRSTRVHTCRETRSHCTIVVAARTQTATTVTCLHPQRWRCWMCPDTNTVVLLQPTIFSRPKSP
mmetsp:Transcript_7559/g.16242  ORF Transcript_7559/g.16242 Transcript_7559/m.16242 type:complete len:220 (-) Transcript_7559:153-812(-)